ADFATSFSDADHVLVTDIYRSREAYDETISAKQIVEQMRAQAQHPDARYVPTLPEAVNTLIAEVKSGDVLITLGAGDGDTVGEQVLEELRK
ncbi:MAG TPA: hypothetical protein VJ020_14610, partial [Anaerolineales bacterium]|nr:hypothetical protein [Anaerolineales bacterium]